MAGENHMAISMVARLNSLQTNGEFEKAYSTGAHEGGSVWGALAGLRATNVGAASESVRS
jgi:hypothetical protein